MGIETDEIPFGVRARQAGKLFRGGKQDDISVIVAIISPSPFPSASSSCSSTSSPTSTSQMGAGSEGTKITVAPSS